MKYLGESFDIHLGGEDLRSTHHPNEIAQSEGATNKSPFARFWLHTKFLLVDGGKMGKSLGNAFTIHDLESHGFSPIDYRYLVLTSHYRSELDFTWQSLKAAQTALERLNRIVLENEVSIPNEDVIKTIIECIANDLGTPQAIAKIWEYTKNETDKDKVAATLMKIDKLLGLNLGAKQVEVTEISDEVRELLEEREQARKNKDWTKSDLLRAKINEAGFHIEDTDSGQHIRPM
jgi:cysteinyl-tRNA synthetase